MQPHHCRSSIPACLRGCGRGRWRIWRWRGSWRRMPQLLLLLLLLLLMMMMMRVDPGPGLWGASCHAGAPGRYQTLGLHSSPPTQNEYLECRNDQESTRAYCIKLYRRKTLVNLKAMWSIGKGSQIFWEYSHLFDFHLKAYYVCIVTWKLLTWNVLSRICRILSKNMITIFVFATRQLLHN